MVLTNYETALLVCTMMGPMLEEFPATKNINKMKERIRKQGQNFAKEDMRAVVMKSQILSLMSCLYIPVSLIRAAHLKS
jgi:hypothetical protein